MTIKRQAHVLYAPGLERHVLRSSDGTANFGLRFLQKVYIVGATFEAMQSWCHQQAHLRWETLHIEEDKKECDKPAKDRTAKTVSGVAVPVLNPSHRNVLDHNDQAEDYISVEELALVQTNINSHYLKAAIPTNQKFTKYSDSCLEEIIDKRGTPQDQSDYEQMKKDIAELASNYTIDLNSSVLVGPDPDDENKAFKLTREATLCEYPISERPSEPATSINAFAEWRSVTDFAFKHCNASQLFGQQLLRNPILMQDQPGLAFASLTGPVHMDARLSIGHTNMFVGTYDPLTLASDVPKVAELTATLSLQALAVFTRVGIESQASPQKQELLNPSLEPSARLAIVQSMWD